jgi:gamma-glutamylcyclotransferase (GGCT)/AIG2-like uncharacterized protein YtfP
MPAFFYSAHFPLFVYGSLLKGSPHPMSAYLWSRASFLGETQLPGRLYDLGSYPGFVSDFQAAERVYGHLALLRADTAEMTWRELDIYEGIEFPDPEYERRLVKPQLPQFGYQQVWLYHYRLPIASGAKWIRSGDFRDYF